MRFAVLVSLLGVGLSARAARRPRYGGTLRVEIRQTISSLDTPEAAHILSSLVFDQLVRWGSNGAIRPALAIAWQHDASYRRWQFQLRSGVQAHDGSPLSAAAVATALAPELGAKASGDQLLIRSERPLPELLSQLAASHVPLPAGRFRIATWAPGKRIQLAANDEHWEGRPFLDGIDIVMGRVPRDQMVDLELGRADLIEIAPGDLRRVPRVWASAPSTLLALTFAGQSDPRAREALSLVIDRGAIHNVLLQRQGEISGGLLPQWLSGYAFVFHSSPELERARKLVADLAPPKRSIALSFDASHPLARLIAERIAINARDAGMLVEVSATNLRAEVKLAFLRLASLDPTLALNTLAATLGFPKRTSAGTASSLFDFERSLIESIGAVPLFHLPDLYAPAPRVKSWLLPGIGKLGQWHFENVWLDEGKP